MGGHTITSSEAAKQSSYEFRSKTMDSRHNKVRDKHTVIYIKKTQPFKITQLNGKVDGQLNY